MTGDEVFAIGLITLCLHKILVRIVVERKLDLAQIALTVAEALGEVNAIREHMRVIHQRIIV